MQNESQLMCPAVGHIVEGNDEWAPRQPRFTDSYSLHIYTYKDALPDYFMSELQMDSIRGYTSLSPRTVHLLIYLFSFFY